MKVDIFCCVIDNWGDAGVCWRLARQMSREWGAQVRLWIDAPEVLQPWRSEWGDALDGDVSPEVCTWSHAVDCHSVVPADLIIEAFACEIPAAYVARIKTFKQSPKWFNLEYLSAEDWVETHHLLNSPQSGGLNKVFYFPGFTEQTGGLLREHDLIARRDAFVVEHPQYWQACTGFEDSQNALKISLFGYEHLPLAQWLPVLAQGEQVIQIAVAAGKAQATFAQTWAQLGYAQPQNGRYQQGNLSAVFLPMLTQTEYDQLLWSADINAVRGEDSLVRAIWAGKPLFWDIYKQDDGVHWDKLRAFCAQMSAGETADWVQAWTRWNMAWNQAQLDKNNNNNSNMTDWPQLWAALLAQLPQMSAAAQRTCQRLSQQADLLTQLRRLI